MNAKRKAPPVAGKQAYKPTAAALSMESLLQILAERFEIHRNRHPNLNWHQVETNLLRTPSALSALAKMESSGGEPDVIQFGREKECLCFIDCSPESPAGRRSLCYDRDALNARKANKPVQSAIDMAALMGCELLTESEYRHLQTVGDFDQKTSSWVQTPANIRALGGALFCDRRFGHIFLYHNGADSYFSSRGFRGILRIAL